MNPQRFFFTTAVISLLSASIAACSSDPGARTEMSVTKTCLRTKCDERNRDSSEACSACSSACSSASYDCNSSTACENSCSDVHCTDAEKSDCASVGFKAFLPEVVDGNLEAACKRAVAHVTSCGQNALSDAACTVFAKTERSERVSVYDCYANTACGADTSACDPQPTTFGDEVCAAGERCGEHCDDKKRQALNAEGGWLRSDAQQAAKDCYANNPACSDAEDCFSAWYEATIF